jgi:hypothetical protein
MWRNYLKATQTDSEALVARTKEILEVATGSTSSSATDTCESPESDQAKQSKASSSGDAPALAPAF